MSSGYIYLLRPLRSITSNEEIYKIGKTKRKNFKRFNEYPSGSILLLQSSCENCDLMERKLLKIFDEHFIKETDYGREYFKGDVIRMKKIINSEIINEIDVSSLGDVDNVGVTKTYDETLVEPYNINSIEYFSKRASLKINGEKLQENELKNENYEFKKFLVEQRNFQKKMLEQTEISNNQIYINNEKIIEQQKDSNKLMDIMIGIIQNKTTISSL